LKNLLSQTPEAIVQAGLHPTADQIELYAYHLPNLPLSNLIVRFYKNIKGFDRHL
jgi:ATP-dependent RNA helicase SUPV3L1/SUV3